MLKSIRTALLSSVAVLGLLAAPAALTDMRAHAADEDQMYAGARNWTGHYFGAGLVLSGVENRGLSGYGDKAGGGGSLEVYDEKGSVVRHNRALGINVEVGHDYQLTDNIVVGVAADVTLNLGRLGMDGYNSKCCSPYAELDVFGRITSQAGLTARVGHTVNNGNTLLYALGGVTLAGYSIGGRYDAYDEKSGSNSINWKKNGVTAGLTLGAGIEHWVGENSTFKLEYRATDLESVSVDAYNGSADGGTEYDPGLIHQLMARFTYRMPN